MAWVTAALLVLGGRSALAAAFDDSQSCYTAVQAATIVRTAAVPLPHASPNCSLCPHTHATVAAHCRDRVRATARLWTADVWVVGEQQAACAHLCFRLCGGSARCAARGCGSLASSRPGHHWRAALRHCTTCLQEHPLPPPPVHPAAG